LTGQQPVRPGDEVLTSTIPLHQPDLMPETRYRSGQVAASLVLQAARDSHGVAARIVEVS